jgi:cytochrome c556
MFKVERLKAAKVLADVAKQRQAADVAALRQTVASLRSSIAKTKGEMASSPSSNNEPSNREDQVDHQRRELKRARAQELVLLEEGDTETRAKRTAEVNDNTHTKHECYMCVVYVNCRVGSPW